MNEINEINETAHNLDARNRAWCDGWDVAKADAAREVPAEWMRFRDQWLEGWDDAQAAA